MPYIGQQPTSVAFLTDTFSGNGSTTAFTLSAAPANTSSVLVAVSGVLQDPSTYSVSGTTLTFSGAPPSGTSNISVRFLGIPASGVTTTAYRTVTEFTATAGQTSFSVPSYTVGFIDVYRNGVMLGSADYTATTGTTVVLASGATLGDLVEVISFQVSSVLNALPQSGGSLSGNLSFAGTAGISGNLPFVGTGNRITGDFSNATIVNRTMFQTITSNSATRVHAIPNGTGNISAFSVINNSDPTNASWGQMSINTAEAAFVSTISGTGSYLPMTFYTGGSERMRVDTSGNLGIGTSSPTGKLTVAAGANEVSTFISTVDTNADLFLKATGTTLGNVRLRANANDMVFITGLAETGRITSTGLMQFNSGYGSVATAYGCRAWVNFNGTGTVAIRGSGNVSSITDVSTGVYGINFTNSMPDTNYAVVGACNNSSYFTDTLEPENYATSNVQIATYSRGSSSSGASSQYDMTFVNVAILR